MAATITEWHDNLHRWFCGAFGGLRTNGAYFYNLQGNLVQPSSENGYFFQDTSSVVNFIYFDNNGNQLSDYQELKNYTWAAGNNATEVSNAVAITGSSSITPTGESLTISHVFVCMNGNGYTTQMPLARISINKTITSSQTLTTSFVVGIEV